MKMIIFLVNDNFHVHLHLTCERVHSVSFFFVSFSLRKKSYFFCYYENEERHVMKQKMQDCIERQCYIPF